MTRRIHDCLRFCLLLLVVVPIAAAGGEAAAKTGEADSDNPAVLALLNGLPKPELVTVPWRPGRFTLYRAGTEEEDHVTARRGVLTGDLYRAPEPATGPAAYAVLLAGCGNTREGANALWLKLWARYLQDIGVGALALDSFTPRGVDGVCGDGSKTWAYRRVDDAHSALAWLAAQPFVDARHVFVIGMSNGGRAALLSVSTAESWRFRRFAAAVALYPRCDQMPPHPLLAPALLLVGEADGPSVRELCGSYVEGRRTTAFQPRLIRYPQAFHLFDVYPRDDDYSLPEVVDSRAQVLAFLREFLPAPDPASERVAGSAE